MRRNQGQRQHTACPTAVTIRMEEQLAQWCPASEWQQPGVEPQARCAQERPHGLGPQLMHRFLASTEQSVSLQLNSCMCHLRLARSTQGAPPSHYLQLDRASPSPASGTTKVSAQSPSCKQDPDHPTN